VPITHRKVVATADDGTSDVRPSNWNDDHSIIFDGVLPGLRRTAAADRYYPAGMYGGSALVAGVAWVTNTQRAFPFIPARDCTVDLIIANVTTAGTSGRMGIYSDDGNCHPGALLAESTTGAVSLTTGVKSWAFATIALKGGTLYWISCNLTGTPVMVSIAVADALPIIGHAATLASGAVAGNGWQQTRTLAALAAWGTGGSLETILSAVVPAFGVRVT
jgi:hypothetical protein